MRRGAERLVSEKEERGREKLDGRGVIRTEADEGEKGRKNFVGGEEGKSLYGGASETRTKPTGSSLPAAVFIIGHGGVLPHLRCAAPVQNLHLVDQRPKLFCGNEKELVACRPSAQPAANPGRTFHAVSTILTLLLIDLPSNNGSYCCVLGINASSPHRCAGCDASTTRCVCMIFLDTPLPICHPWPANKWRARRKELMRGPLWWDTIVQASFFRAAPWAARRIFFVATSRLREESDRSRSRSRYGCVADVLENSIIFDIRSRYKKAVCDPRQGSKILH